LSILRIRRSQLISKHGVGSIYPGTDGISRLTAGLDKWFTQEYENSENKIIKDEFKIKEWRLEQRLKVSHFRSPPDFRKFEYYLQSEKNLELKIPFLRFPTWHRCQKCEILYRPSKGLYVKSIGPCTREYDGKECKGTYVQVPFVIFCQSGHIEDFPWNEWVHQDHDTKCKGTNLKYQKDKNKSGGLDSVEIICLTCSKGGKPVKRNLKNITSSSNNNNSTILTDTLEKNYSFKCKGKKTWLGYGHSEKCDHPVRASLRSASNLYYSKTFSSIYLPSVENDILSEIQLLMTENSEIDNLISIGKKFDQSNEQILKTLIEDYQEEFKKFSKKDISQALNLLLDRDKAEETHSNRVQGDNESDKETPFRRLEYKRLLSDISSEELIIEKKKLDKYEKIFSSYFSSISLVKKLRETRVLYGFSRLFPDANKDKDPKEMQSMLRSKISKTNDWLPAVKVYGEGVFLELKEEIINSWESKPEVIDHINKIQENLDALTEKRNMQSRTISPRFVLLHTLSHILIDKFIYESGYHAASLRERIYCSTNPNGPMSGLLIYTADGDSEGTMGGLVRMGEHGIIETVFENAIKTSRWCAADPVCTEIGKRDGQGLEKINLAACHNCCLLAETSCEEFNRLLDRGVLIDKEFGFFNQI